MSRDSTDAGSLDTVLIKGFERLARAMEAQALATVVIMGLKPEFTASDFPTFEVRATENRVRRINRLVALLDELEKG